MPKVMAAPGGAAVYNLQEEKKNVNNPIASET